MSFKYSGTFAITGAPTITVDSPNSGTFYVGDAVTITWSTTGTVGNVKIKLYNTANSLIATLTSSTSNDGSFNWTISGSYITAHETEYQLKIEQVSGGSPSDYSGNLEIYPYMGRSASDDIGIGQGTVGKSSDIWKHVRTTSDDISISQGTVGKSSDIWKHIRSTSDDISIGQAIVKVITGHRDAVDNIGIGQSIAKASDLWKHVFTNTDDISIGQGTVGKDVDLWKHLRSTSDDIGIGQAIVKVITGHRDASDDIGIGQAIVKASDLWKHVFTNTDDIGIGQSIAKASDSWKHMFTNTDDIGIDQGTVGKIFDLWKHVFTNTDDVSISQGTVGKDVDLWKHIKTISDDVSISQGTVGKVTDIWKHLKTTVDNIGIEQSVVSVVTGHRDATDGISISQGTVAKDTDLWKHLRIQTDDISISQGTVAKDTDVWKHLRSQTDDISIGQGTVGKDAGTWRSITTLAVTDDVGIQQTFAYLLDKWTIITSASDGMALSDAPFFYVTRETGVMYFIYQNTVINLGNANRVPITKPIFPKQLSKLSGDGKAKVTDYSSAVEFVDVKVRVDQATRTVLYGFFRDTVAWTKNVFTFKDGEGSNYDVRLWDADGFNLPILKGGHVDVGVRLRKELYS